LEILNSRIESLRGKWDIRSEVSYSIGPDQGKLLIIGQDRGEAKGVESREKNLGKSGRGRVNAVLLYL